MLNLSVGAGLVLRQLLFLSLMLIMGAAAYIGVLNVRDLPLRPASPAQRKWGR